jgi:Cytochrome c oxidase subunit IV
MQSSQRTRRPARPPVENPAVESPRPATTEGTLGEHDTASEHIHLPPPTIWPMTTAAGVTLAFLGLVTSFPVSILGLLIAIYAVVSWVQELRHELH